MTLVVDASMVVAALIDAAMAHADLLDLRVRLFPYEPFASRVWALRETVTAHDAWYVAIAEAIGCPLATLDRRLSSAPGTRCDFTVPTSQKRPRLGH